MEDLSAEDLVEALQSTFRIAETCLDRWTWDMLDEELRRPEFGDDWVHLRGSVLQRVFTHDAYDSADLNGTLGAPGCRRSTSGTGGTAQSGRGRAVVLHRPGGVATAPVLEGPRSWRTCMATGRIRHPTSRSSRFTRNPRRSRSSQDREARRSEVDNVSGNHD